MFRHIVAIALVILLTACNIPPCNASATPRRAMLTAISGSVLIQAEGHATAVPARKGMELKSGDRIITGKDGIAEIRFDDGSISRISPDSRIDLRNLSREGADGSETTVLDNKWGKVWNNAKDVAQKNSRFKVNTPSAVASVRGTNFLVEVGDEQDTTVRVYGGIVGVGPDLGDGDDDEGGPGGAPPGDDEDDGEDTDNGDGSSGEVLVNPFQQLQTGPGEDIPDDPDPLDALDVDDWEKDNLAEDNPAAYVEVELEYTAALLEQAEQAMQQGLEEIAQILAELELLQQLIREETDPNRLAELLALEQQLSEEMELKSDVINAVYQDKQQLTQSKGNLQELKEQVKDLTPEQLKEKAQATRQEEKAKSQERQQRQQQSQEKRKQAEEKRSQTTQAAQNLGVQNTLSQAQVTPELLQKASQETLPPAPPASTPPPPPPESDDTYHDSDDTLGTITADQPQGITIPVYASGYADITFSPADVSVSAVSSNTGIATVTVRDAGPAKRFTVTGISPGTATITVTATCTGYSSVTRQFTVTVTEAASGWKAVGDPGFSEGAADYVSLKVTEGGIPYVAYSDHGAETPRALSVQKYNGSGWSYVGERGFSGGRADFVDFDLLYGFPYVAYSDHSAATPGAVTVKKFDLVWETMGAPCFSEGMANSISLHFPFVAYSGQLANPPGTISVKMFDSGDWLSVGSPGILSATTGNLSLCSNYGTPYVAYSDNQADSKITVTVREQVYSAPPEYEWQPVGIQGFSGEVADHLSLQVVDGTPYVAYKDHVVDEVTGDVSVKHFFDGSWNKIGEPFISTGTAEYISLVAMQTCSTFHHPVLFVSFKDLDDRGKAKVMGYLPYFSGNEFQGFRWESIGGAVSAGQADYISLAAYNDNETSKLFIAFKDHANDGRVTVKEHQFKMPELSASINGVWVDWPGDNLEVTLVYTKDLMTDVSNVEKSQFSFEDNDGTVSPDIIGIGTNGEELRLTFNNYNSTGGVKSLTYTQSGNAAERLKDYEGKDVKNFDTITVPLLD